MEVDKLNKVKHGITDTDMKTQGDIEGVTNDFDSNSQSKIRIDPVIVEQAWDDEQLVGGMRVDPPPSLHLVPMKDQKTNII